jgi:hypothetical protein
VLRDRTKRFSFLLGEAGLRTPDIPPEVMQEQLDSIVLSSVMSHIEVGVVVPVAALLPCSTSFLILDEQTVVISLDTREVVIREPEEVARYTDIFERLQKRAVRGADLAEVVRSIAGELAGRTSGKAE